MKALLRKCLPLGGAAFLRLFFGLFFARRYLRGPHFDRELSGWSWAWRSLWTQKFLGINRHVPWPVSPSIRVGRADRIEFDPADLNNFQGTGNYFQCHRGRIRIGKGSYIAPGVGIITENHDPADPDRHLPAKDVTLGPKCWIGMNAILLPGVTLGPNTVVAAGAVVTKSFTDGNQVLMGTPAAVSRTLAPSRVEQTTSVP